MRREGGREGRGGREGGGGGRGREGGEGGEGEEEEGFTFEKGGKVVPFYPEEQFEEMEIPSLLLSSPLLSSLLPRFLHSPKNRRRDGAVRFGSVKWKKPRFGGETEPNRVFFQK